MGPHDIRPRAHKVLARLCGLDLIRCFDVEGTGFISRVVLIRALKHFDSKVFTDEAIADILDSIKGCQGDATPIAEIIELVGPPPTPSAPSSPELGTRGTRPEPALSTRKEEAPVPLKPADVALKETPMNITELDAERLARLVRTGSSASCSSQWEVLKDDYQILLSEAGNKDSGIPIKAMFAEGDDLREERAKLHAEHIQLSAALSKS